MNDSSISRETEIPLISDEARKNLYVHAYRLYEGGKYDEAVRFFQFLTTTEMSRKRNWMGLGSSLLMVMDYNKAVEAFAFAAFLDQNDPYPHIYAAECLFALGSITEGKEALVFAEKLAKSHDKMNEIKSRVTLLREAWCHGKK